MTCRRSKVFLLMLMLIMIFVLFSIKVTAENNQISLLYEGIDFNVKITCDQEAGISQNATLNVIELCEGSKEFQEFYHQTEQFISQKEEKEISDVCFLDISILDNGKKIEPDKAVEVMIDYKNGVTKEKNDDIKVIHFVEDGKKELLDVTEEKKKGNKVTKISYEQESFSVIGMITFNGVDSNINGGNSKILSETECILINKKWSDGNENHNNDSIVISLYELLSTGKWEKCNELTLDNSNNWHGEFKNLDYSKSYSIKETKILSDDMNKTDTYRSEISRRIIKKWCIKPENQLIHGENVVLIFGKSPKKVLRKSGEYDELNLRTTNISVDKNDSNIEFVKNELGNNNVWKCLWNEESEDWSLYNIHGDSYLSLIYDEEQEKFLWTTCREMMEGSHLSFENGVIYSTINNVTKCIGNVSGNGPYEGVEPGNENEAIFQLYSYEIVEPVSYEIINTKNEITVQTEIDDGITTSKMIDYLGDGKDNPDTTVEKKVSEEVLKDLYRLKLGMKMQPDQSGLDLLMVIDVSSSMRDNSDAKDENGNQIQRSEALQQALNQFIPSFLDENDRNRISIVAFEMDSMILQEWTSNKQEILDKINYEVDGNKPLYAGRGTNYESALIRAHESLMMRGYTDNAKAMIFLSDGEPTVCLDGNDDIEKGNVTVLLGKSELSSEGIKNILPDGIEFAWVENTIRAKTTAEEAIISFRNQHPDMMIGTIAFNTVIKDHLKNLATDSKYVVQIQNGSPKDLIDSMELISEYRATEITLTDELSENVELYEEQPDFKISSFNEMNKETVLYLSETGLSEEGKKVLNNENPVKVVDKKVKMSFKDDYVIPDFSIYELSFNVNVSQIAFNKYADANGVYSDKGDEETDISGNETSSGKNGFFSNGEGTKLTYVLNGAEVQKNYRKPVVQTREGTMTVLKEDMKGNRIEGGAVFELYRVADEEDKNTVNLNGYKEEFVKVRGEETNKNGEIEFKHLRLAPFDKGYSYYLLEKEPPEGFERYSKPIKVDVYENFVEIADQNIMIESQGKTVTVRNAEIIEFSFIKVAAHNYENKLSGAEFELYILSCEKEHIHKDECWNYLEKQISNPEVQFEKIVTGNTYKLVEVKAPDGYILPTGFWILEIDYEKNIQIKGDVGLPDVKKIDNERYVLENEQILQIPVTGGKGAKHILFVGLSLIVGGIIMNNKKKFFNFSVICLVFMLVFQMFGTTAFAIEKTDKGIIKVKGVEKNVQVQAYRLMDVVYDYDVQQPKNPVYQWVDEVSEWVLINYPQYIDQSNENAVKNLFSKDEEETKVAELYAQLAVAIKNGDVTLENKTVIADAESVLIENLTMGNYFILIEGGAKVYRPLSANVVPEWMDSKWEMAQPIVEAKASTPTITKTVTNGLEKDHADIGDKLGFELNAVVPTYPQNALAKKYIVSDKLSQGLTLLKDSIKVYGVNNHVETLLENSYLEITERPVEDKNISFALDFKYDVICKYESLKISYDVLLNENAVVGEEGNSNHAYLDYSNNPYVTTSWKTDEDSTTVYTYGMKITKVDEKEEKGLSGAEFTLSKDDKNISFAGTNGNYHVAAESDEKITVLKTNEKGELSLDGLDAGTYYLTEVKAPAGYVKLQNPIEITITDNDMDGKPETGSKESVDGYIPLTVKNDKGFTLPVTGGMGTLMFNIAGVALIGAGLSCMVGISRNNKKKK